MPKTDPGWSTVPVIYIDVVWLVNLVMDAVLVVTTCWLMKRPVRAGRVTLAAVIGACYALLLFFPALSAFTSWPGKAAVSLIIVAIGIGRRNWLDLARVSAAFYFVSFVFAGCAVALRFALPSVSVANTVQVSAHGIAVAESFGGLVIVVSVPIAIAFTRYIVRHVRQAHLRAGLMYRVRASFPDGDATFVGLVDSGNQLRDPVSRQPVCFVDADVLAPFLPQQFATAVANGRSLVDALGDQSDPRFTGKFAMIPYRGAGGQTQLTVAVRPNAIALERSGLWQTVAHPCWLALHSGQLAHDKSFQAILHMEIITGDERFETSEFQRDQHEAPNSAATAVGERPPQIPGHS